MNITPFESGPLRPLNGTVVLKATKNETVRLLYVNATKFDWRYRGKLPECDGVLVYSNARGATALVDGENVSLPYCAGRHLRLP